MAEKGAAHSLCCAEAGSGGNSIKRGTAACEAAAGFIKSCALDELRGREPCLGNKMPGETALAHMATRRKLRHGKRFARICDNISAELCETIIANMLCGKLCGELRLTAGAHQIHDVMTRK